jgi:hypothetical protein
MTSACVQRMRKSQVPCLRIYGHMTQCKLNGCVSTSCGNAEFPARLLTIILLLLDTYDVSVCPAHAEKPSSLFTDLWPHDAAQT